MLRLLDPTNRRNAGILLEFQPGTRYSVKSPRVQRRVERTAGQQFVAGLDDEVDALRWREGFVVLHQALAGVEHPLLVVVIGVASGRRVGLDVGGFQFAAAEIDASRLGDLVHVADGEIEAHPLGLCRFVDDAVDKGGEICGRHVLPYTTRQ